MKIELNTLFVCVCVCGKVQQNNMRNASLLGVDSVIFVVFAVVVFFSFGFERLYYYFLMETCQIDIVDYINEP